MIKRIAFFISLWLPALATPLAAQIGGLSGRVTDAGNRQPLFGVNVMLAGTVRGAATDMAGEYTIENVPVGIYTLEFSYIGYEKKRIVDVIVKSNRIGRYNTELAEKPVEGETVRITSGFFETPHEAAGSVQTMSYEEIRRSPGAMEDVSRSLQVLAGVNPSSDARNDLVIRGGSPTEVLYRIDQIDFANPNHFGTQGATGGPISMVNNEFIESVEFYAGGFGAQYGHKLSGAIDIHFREGNRKAFSGKLDLNFGGAGGYFEGPLGNSKGSFLIGVHRSFLDLLSGIMGYGGVPIYSNIQGKVVQDFGKHQWSLLLIGGDDKINAQAEVNTEDFATGVPDTVDYGWTQFRSRQITAGSSLRSLWSPRFFTLFTLSYSTAYFFTNADLRTYAGVHVAGDEDLHGETMVSETDVYDNTSTEEIAMARLTATLLPHPLHSLSLGSYCRLDRFDHDIRYAPPGTPDEYGRVWDLMNVQVDQRFTPKYGGFLQYTWTLGRLTTHWGARYDIFRYIGSSTFSPRLAAGFQVSRRLTLNAAAGRYFQPPEWIWITAKPGNRETLTDIRCDHLLGGAALLLFADLRLTLEAYWKEYSRYPVAADSGHEMITMANYGNAYGGNLYPEQLTGEGKGTARGLEFMAQKRMTNNWYGLLAYSYSVIGHEALDGIRRPGSFDNRHVFNVVFGYRLTKAWEFSAKWRYAGGTPYTPYDQAASVAADQGVLDLTRINGERYAPYHRLDLRMDYRSFFRKMTLITYVSIQNVYARKNILMHYWDSAAQETRYYYQMGFFPVGGVSLEF